ncbi:MAG: RbsD/FucU family protein [Prolixibacteraceae bacterium]
MLKQIPTKLSPELFKTMMEMGHGDELILTDGNFPAASNAQRLIRADGHNVPELLDAILQFYPIDTFVEQPISLMAKVSGDNYKPEIWPVFENIVSKHFSGFSGFEMVERFDFYERAKKAYAIVATSETARYANIILKKGII